MRTISCSTSRLIPRPAGAPTSLRAIKLAGDKLAVPSQDGVRPRHIGHLGEDLAAQAMTDLGQCGSLGVRELQPPFQLGLQDPIFGDQIFAPRQQLLVHIHSSSTASRLAIVCSKNRSQRHLARRCRKWTTHRLFDSFNFLTIRGRDGFWLARWLRAQGIEAHVIHAASVAVSREHRRAKTDRLDTELLKRAFIGWLRGERDHCKMVAVPTLAQEDAKRPSRERESLVGEQSRIVNRMKAALARLGIRGFNPKLKKAVERLDGLRTPEGEPIPPNTLAELKHDMERRRLVRSQIRDIEGTRLERLKQAPGDGPHVMVRLLARVIGVGVETADMLVQEVLSRNLRDRRAVARYGGLTGSPDESGSKRREKGLAKAGNARVRRGLIQLAWRFLMFQKGSALAHWFYARTKNAPQTRKTMIVALARKLLIALWRLAREGAIPEGIVLRPAL